MNTELQELELFQAFKTINQDGKLTKTIKKGQLALLSKEERSQRIETINKALKEESLREYFQKERKADWERL